MGSVVASVVGIVGDLAGWWAKLSKTAHTAILIAIMAVAAGVGATWLVGHLQTDAANKATASALYQHGQDSISALRVQLTTVQKQGRDSAAHLKIVARTELLSYRASRDSARNAETALRLAMVTDTACLRAVLAFVDVSDTALTRADTVIHTDSIQKAVLTHLVADADSQAVLADKQTAAATKQIQAVQGAASGFQRPAINVGYSTLGALADVTAGYGRIGGIVSYTTKGGLFAGATIRVSP